MVHKLGYVYTGSDMFMSVWDRIDYGTDPLYLHGTGSKLERSSSIWDHLYEWTDLVPDSRSDRYRILQVPCKHKDYPYQFHTGSKRIRSRVNAALKEEGDSAPGPRPGQDRGWTGHFSPPKKN